MPRSREIPATRFNGQELLFPCEPIGKWARGVSNNQRVRGILQYFREDPNAYSLDGKVPGVKAPVHVDENSESCELASTRPSYSNRDHAAFHPRMAGRRSCCPPRKRTVWTCSQPMDMPIVILMTIIILIFRYRKPQGHQELGKV